MIYKNYQGGNENATTRKNASGPVSATKVQLELSRNKPKLYEGEKIWTLI